MLSSLISESAGEDEDQFARGSGSPGGGSADEGSEQQQQDQPGNVSMSGNQRPRGFLTPGPPRPLGWSAHVAFDPEAPPSPTGKILGPPPLPGPQMCLLEKPEIDKKVKVSVRIFWITVSRFLRQYFCPLDIFTPHRFLSFKIFFI